MKVLWAPWRMEYILGEDKPQGCIFCPWPDEDLAERLVLFSGKLTRIMMNKFPYINGHLLIAPRAHKAGLEDMTADELSDQMALLMRCQRALAAAVAPQGFNIGMNLGQVAGAGVPGHAHWHIVPRWKGDSNFMPVVACTKVIPQSLETLWQLLRRADTEP